MTRLPSPDRVEFVDSVSCAYGEWQRSHLELLDLEAQLVATAESAANGFTSAAPELDKVIADRRTATQRLYAALLQQLEHRWR
jgi:hypothetical protein